MCVKALAALFYESQTVLCDKHENTDIKTEFSNWKHSHCDMLLYVSTYVQQLLCNTWQRAHKHPQQMWWEWILFCFVLPESYVCVCVHGYFEHALCWMWSVRVCVCAYCFNILTVNVKVKLYVWMLLNRNGLIRHLVDDSMKRLLWVYHSVHWAICSFQSTFPLYSNWYWLFLSLIWKMYANRPFVLMAYDEYFPFSAHFCFYTKHVGE